MDKPAKKYPGIRRAALEIALDNGGINCRRSVKQQDREFEKWLAKQPEEILPPIDLWLAALSDDDLSTACCGEQEEMAELLKGAPPFTDSVLNDYFDEVC